MSTVTQQIADYVLRSRPLDIPEPVRREASRALLNIVGCMLGGCRHEAVERTIAALDPFSGPREASVVGRTERLDVFKAALVNCLSSAVLAYDDVHLATVIHPSGPVASVLLALAERNRIEGTELVHALALGIELQCRLANMLAVAPARTNDAFYLTGFTGGIGAAIAAGRVLRLTEKELVWAIGIAAARAGGTRETHGTLAQSLVPACAAEEGLFAALLAQRGVATSDTPIEGRRGLAKLFSEGNNLAALTERLGEHFELMRNTLKPIPTGIVTHAAITGALELAHEKRPAPEDIARVELTVHPLCLELCGRRAPANADEATLSVYHWVAIALLHRRVSVRFSSDETVRDPAIIALRERVEARTDAAYRKDEAHIRIALRDGRTLERHVEHALGSIERPMSDAELEAKFLDLAQSALSRERAERLLAQCRGAERLPDSALLVRGALPGSGEDVNRA